MPGPDVRVDLGCAVVEDTVRFWQRRTSERVSAEDAAECIRNVAEFFRLVSRWDAADEPQGPGNEFATQENAPEGITR